MDAEADDIVFRPVWQIFDRKLVQTAKDFWRREGTTEAFIDKRINELCAIAYKGEDPVAVATTDITYLPALRHRFFNYRCMVASHFRQHDMAWRISAYSFKLLQEWSLQNPHEKVQGLLLYIETDKFAVPQRKPVREHLGITLNFVGYSANGRQLRVVWFDHAELDDNPASG